jgi:hypothetical protein
MAIQLLVQPWHSSRAGYATVINYCYAQTKALRTVMSPFIDVYKCICSYFRNKDIDPTKSLPAMIEDALS